jgi:hypothetical protein
VKVRLTHTNGNGEGREAGGYYRTSRPGEKGDDDIVHQILFGVYLTSAYRSVPVIDAQSVSEVAADRTTTYSAWSPRNLRHHDNLGSWPFSLH